MNSYIIKTKEGRAFIVQEKNPELAAKRITSMGLKWIEIKLAGDDSGESITRNNKKHSQIMFSKEIIDIDQGAVGVAISRGFSKFSKESAKVKYSSVSVSDLLVNDLKFDPIL
jgi:hypothetical protein